MPDIEVQQLGTGGIETPAPVSARAGRALPLPALERLPWWAALLIIAGLIVGYIVIGSEQYRDVLFTLSEGVRLTLVVTVVAYALALLIGLIAGLMRVSKNPILYTASTLYVEVIRGIPLLVQIFYVFYVIAPLLAERVPEEFQSFFRTEVNMAIVALAIGYGAYLAEVYRAGIESIPRGQMEAARSLGMTYAQAMRYVILPQAIRVVLPPLGNDFVSMLKDSSLASAISVRELTLVTKNRSAATFRGLEHWTIAALLYLVLTLGLSLVVRLVERRWAAPK